MTNAHKYNSAASRFAVKAAFAFPDLCTIETSTDTTSRGQVSQSWATLHANVPCLGRPLSGSERVAGAASIGVEVEEWLMPAQVGGAEIAIRVNHRFVVAARGTQGARTYQVQSVGSVSAVLLKILATRVG